MIRISKSQIVPESLTETQTYDGEDVQERLLHDQHRKCYLCERTRDGSILSHRNRRISSENGRTIKPAIQWKKGITENKRRTILRIRPKCYQSLSEDTK